MSQHGAAARNPDAKNRTLLQSVIMHYVAFAVP
jgi:hypothetical protein